MNIFVVHPDPAVSASVLDDLRLNKMILETAQLLSGAARLLFKVDNKDIPALYKLTHQNHPCSIWARANYTNFAWLLQYFDHLAQEKIRRSKVEHLSHKKLYLPLLDLIQNVMTLEEYFAIQPVFNFNCTDFKAHSTFEAYQKCLDHKWDVIDPSKALRPTWKHAKRPNWSDLA